MKKRHGFVSNSSSSSFLLIGTSIDISEAASLIDEGKNIVFVSTNELNEGRDVISNITKEHIKFISKNIDEYSYCLYNVLLSNDHDGWTDSFNVEALRNAFNNIPDDVEDIEIVRIRKDYHCHDDIKDFKDYYMRYNNNWQDDEDDEV